MFKSTLATNQPIMYHALSAFNLERETDVNVTSHGWGVMVEVLVGELKGLYDYHAQDHSFVAA